MSQFGAVTVGRLPLVQVDEFLFVSNSVPAAGISPVTIGAWRRTCNQVRRFAFDAGLLKRWPPVVMYATIIEAGHDQFRHDQDAARLAGRPDICGWAIFGTGHKGCRPGWRRVDRTIIHLNALGGDLPVTRILLHEVAHHHLYQMHRVRFADHLTEATEARIKGLIPPWLYALAPLVGQDDHPALIRALEILVAERRLNEPERL